MGSGYFPLGAMDKHGKDLLQAVALVENVVREMMDNVWTQDQTDNAASDGGSIALLNLAAELIRQEVYPNTKDSKAQEPKPAGGEAKP